MYAGYPFNGKMLWGEWSVESQYVTSGQSPAAASSSAAHAASASAAGSRKKERKKAPEKKNNAAVHQPVVDDEQALEQLKVSQNITNKFQYSAEHCRAQKNHPEKTEGMLFAMRQTS